MPPGAPALPALRILVVDDDEVDRMIVRRAFARGLGDGQGEPPTIVDATSGDAALAILRGDPSFSLVVLDHEMPGMTGLETVRAIRLAGSMVPILVVTGSEDELVAALMAAGANDFLQKADLTPERVRRRVNHMMRLTLAEATAEAARAEVARAQQRTAAILDQLPIATMVASPDGTITVINRAAIALFGLDAGVAHTVDELCAGLNLEPGVRPLRAALTAARRGAASPPLEFRFTPPPGAAAAGALHTLCATGKPFFVRDAFAGVVVITDDITPMRRLLDDLGRAVAARDEVLAIVSHDLRNPLHAVALALDELADPALDVELRARYIAAVRRSLGRADQLIADLLDVSRLEAGALVLERRPISVGEVVASAVRDHALLLREAGMAARVSIGPDVARLVVDVDVQRTGQALGNLVGNAIKHAPGTQAIELTARPVEEGVELVVADHGNGIDPADLRHIFDRFFQGETRRRSAPASAWRSPAASRGRMAAT